MSQAINEVGSSDLKQAINKFTVIRDAQYSMIRGDDTILVSMDISSMEAKKKIISFAESDSGKEVIVDKYKKIFDELDYKPKHGLKTELLNLWK